jgi:hypothetical protein
MTRLSPMTYRMGEHSDKRRVRGLTPDESDSRKLTIYPGLCCNAHDLVLGLDIAVWGTALAAFALLVFVTTR